jgi:hypothetical protein
MTFDWQKLDWQKLSKIREIQEYFEADFTGFKNRIEYHIVKLEQVAPEELEKLAIIRVVEVTNGCTQHGFRRNDENCLTVEQTRDCMKKVIGFMNNQRVDFPSGKSISFNESTNQLMREVRELYQDAFKNNIPDQEREFYAYSTANFLVIGHQRFENALQLVKQEFEDLFSTHYIEKGRKYITTYIEAISVEV